MNTCLAAGTKDHDVIAGPYAAARKSSRKPAKVEMRTIYPLHGHSEGLCDAFIVHFNPFKPIEKGRPFVPEHSPKFLRKYYPRIAPRLEKLRTVLKHSDLLNLWKSATI